MEGSTELLTFKFVHMRHMRTAPFNFGVWILSANNIGIKSLVFAFSQLILGAAQ
jgi:hypothetical protein